MKQPVKVAIIDLYNNEQNQGMRCIQDTLNDLNGKVADIPIEYHRYNTRAEDEIPTKPYDIYISSGGPGSPFEGEGAKWELDYFNMLDKILHNNSKIQTSKQYVFFICHSFQMMCRYFDLAKIVERENRAFGIFPIYKTIAGESDPIIASLPNPFYAADFRQWQVVEQNNRMFDELGAELLCIERVREKYPDTRALMGIRISDEMMGTQFHPEADPPSMYFHFKQPERKLQVIEEYDEATYFEMLNHLENPDNITLTKNTILPGFLTRAIEELRPQEIAV